MRSRAAVAWSNVRYRIQSGSSDRTGAEDRCCSNAPIRPRRDCCCGTATVRVAPVSFSTGRGGGTRIRCGSLRSGAAGLGPRADDGGRAARHGPHGGGEEVEIAVAGERAPSFASRSRASFDVWSSRTASAANRRAASRLPFCCASRARRYAASDRSLRHRRPAFSERGNTRCHGSRIPRFPASRFHPGRAVPPVP